MCKGDGASKGDSASEGGSVPRGGDRLIPWEEVRRHDKLDDRWLVVDGSVYDITNWSKRHPGGGRVIGHYAGQDATDAFRAFHNDLSYVRKFLKPLMLGRLPPEQNQRDDITTDFRELRVTAEKMGLFKPSLFFYFFILVHVVAMDVASYLNMLYFGTGWLPYLGSVILYSTVQAQAGWLQHDFGHLSVFHNSSVDHFVHYITMCLIKGASPKWWNHMHYQHHAKPNVMDKDPDVRIDKLFVVGEDMPVKVARERPDSMPFNHQHKYFFFIGPPLLFPTYFQYMTFRHVITRRLWMDLFLMLVFIAKFLYLYLPLLGVGWTIVYYFTIRCVESHWFVWVTQSNHIPMEISEERFKDWVPLQIQATCNIEGSAFNDWFTGHLNFQCEHHLFPTMPRHNYYKIAPLVKSLCEKHGIEYRVKPLMTAFVDIYRSLKYSGELWSQAYQEFHHD